MYKWLIRPVLFRFDPEKVHYFSFKSIETMFKIPGINFLLSTRFKAPATPVKMFGLDFKNPVGLAAGFDKDAILIDKWKYMGFGFVEVGTVTPRPQGGNEKPRLFRLPKDKAIINRMGFNNGGAGALIERLKDADKGDLIVGANIGKNKDTPNEKAVDDYMYCFEHLFPYVDYFVVNVSSPNTPGLRRLQEKGPLTEILSTLQHYNQSQERPKPLLLKIAPDLSYDEIDDILEVAETTSLSGLIATNTTIRRDNLRAGKNRILQIGKGGLSGKPLTMRSREVINYIHQRTEGKLAIIGVGGIMDKEDARSHMEAGASLIQVYTGFVYEGPSFVKKLVKGLSAPDEAEKLKQQVLGK
ncbi:MAG: quinone-dependent dihydroorotate dehydrogenase [Bacteroidota bacterium]